MKIISLRHGKPELDLKGRLSASEIKRLVMCFYNIAIPIAISTAKKINNLPNCALPLCSSRYLSFNSSTS